MNPQKIARVTGVLFVITFIASIPALILYGPVLNNPDYIVSAGADTRVQWGAFLEVLTALAGIGTAVVLFPIVKRQNEVVALSYVASRDLAAEPGRSWRCRCRLAPRRRQVSSSGKRLDLPARARLHGRHRERDVAGLPDV